MQHSDIAQNIIEEALKISKLPCIVDRLELSRNKYAYTPVHLVESVRNHNPYMRAEERVAWIAHDWMLGAGAITKHARKKRARNA